MRGHLRGVDELTEGMVVGGFGGSGGHWALALEGCGGGRGWVGIWKDESGGGGAGRKFALGCFEALSRSYWQCH